VDYAAARSNMVESQLRTNKVTDVGLLEAFESLPRELFVPQPKRGIAYVDEDIPLAEGRHLMEPQVLARLLQAADIRPGDVVLDIACGTGYASAIMAKLTDTVVALESDAGLAETANETLSSLSIDNVVVVQGPLAEGYAKQAPYNVILMAGAVAEVPRAVFDQLAEDGRLVTVVKDRPGLGRACLFRRAGAVVSHRVLFDAGTPLLPGFAREPGFVF
jgi:protein-L-isoaspartate(D-aspartate) O-methyltransferase